MSAFVGSLKNNRLLVWSGGCALALALVGITVSNLDRARWTPEPMRPSAVQETLESANSPAASRAAALTYLAASKGVSVGSLPSDRKIVRTSSLEMTVGNPVDAAEKIRMLVDSLGGYIESSQVNTQDNPSATLTLRVPAGKLEAVKAELRALSIHVDSEKTDAEDVTKQYVDMDARLRNLRAEEAQYLTIMKSATKVQDMLDVSEKLSSVRGEIEQQQAEFATLSKQVETVALTIALRAPVATDALGFHWRPLYQLKLAAHDALDGLASYASIMTAVILYLPVILLWVATSVLGAVFGWRVVRWVARALFGWKSAVVVAQ